MGHKAGAWYEAGDCDASVHRLLHMGWTLVGRADAGWMWGEAHLRIWGWTSGLALFARCPDASFTKKYYQSKKGMKEIRNISVDPAMQVFYMLL
jgi:hypothetical protein